MKTFVKIALVSIPLMIAAPSFAQIRWGVDLHFGTPAPREVVVERPYPDAVWYPGYYNYVGYRNVWVPGRWERPARFREEHREFRGRDFDRDHRYSERGHSDGDRGRGGSYDGHQGRIR